MVYKDENGVTLYPTCSWEKNQHKLYNAYDRAWLRREEGDDTAWDEVDELEYLLEIFDAHVVGGVVYAPYKASIRIKEYIAGYDVRKDFMGYWKEA